MIESKTLFDSSVRNDMHDRLKRLSATQSPLWGRFEAPRMVCHVRTGLELTLAAAAPRSATGLMARFPVNWMMIYMMPWPKAKAESPPELLVTEPGDWQQDVAQLHERIDQFERRSANDAWPESVGFGQISGHAHGVLQYRHLDHHLRQFGV